MFLLRYYDEMEALADEFQDANGKKVPFYYGFFIHNSLYYFETGYANALQFKVNVNLKCVSPIVKFKIYCIFMSCF